MGIVRVREAAMLWDMVVIGIAAGILSILGERAIRVWRRPWDD